MNKPSPKKRCGTSLTEMVVVMSLAGFVMLFGSGIIVISMRADQRLGEVRRESMPLQQLAVQLREDVIQLPANQLELNDDGKSLNFPVQNTAKDQPAGSRVEYVIRDHICNRHLKNSAGELLSREQFRTARKTEMTWRFNEESKLLSLQLTRAATDAEPGRSQSLVVNVGRMPLAVEEESP